MRVPRELFPSNLHRRNVLQSTRDLASAEIERKRCTDRIGPGRRSGLIWRTRESGQWRMKDAPQERLCDAQTVDTGEQNHFEMFGAIGLTCGLG
jgi:hypothetical protein